MEINHTAQQGWQCPVCKRIYAPSVVMCFYCGGEDIKIDVNTAEDSVKKFLSDEVRDFAKQYMNTLKG